MRNFSRILRHPGWLILLLVALTGCATYQPEHLTPEKVAAGLEPPTMPAVRTQAASFKHPLLPEVAFDDRDGFGPDEVAVLAVITNPLLRAARDQRGIALAQLLIAGILPNSQLSYGLASPTGSHTGGLVNSFDLGLSWNFSSLISRPARLDAAQAHAKSIDLEIAWQEWQVAEAARLHTFQLCNAKKALAVARQSTTELNKLRDQVKLGVELKVKTTLELATAENQLLEARNLLLQAQTKVEQERLALNRSLGWPAEKVINLEKNITPRIESSLTVQTLTQEAAKQRLDLVALKLGYESQEARVRAAIRSQFPQISLGLTRGKDTDGLRTIGFGVDLELPIFDRNQGAIAKERASRKQLFDEYLARLFTTQSDINQLARTIKSTQAQIAAYDIALAAQKKLCKKYRQAAALGEIDIFSYYQTQNALLQKQTHKIALEQQLIDSGIALEIASGRYGLVVSKTPLTTLKSTDMTTTMEASK